MTDPVEKLAKLVMDREDLREQRIGYRRLLRQIRDNVASALDERTCAYKLAEVELELANNARSLRKWHKEHD